MTPTELAQKLDGIEYPFRLRGFLAAEAIVDNLVVVYGASDDLMEFEGVINDEVGAYGGHVALIDQEGVLPDRDSIEDDDVLERWFKRRKTAAKIRAVWAPKEPPVSWLYETDIPHATFNIMEDGEVYCRAIVIALADLPAAA